jgi:hypothetical protein
MAADRKPTVPRRARRIARIRALQAHNDTHARKSSMLAPERSAIFSWW